MSCRLPGGSITSGRGSPPCAKEWPRLPAALAELEEPAAEALRAPRVPLEQPHPEQVARQPVRGRRRQPVRPVSSVSVSQWSTARKACSSTAASRARHLCLSAPECPGCSNGTQCDQLRESQHDSGDIERERGLSAAVPRGASGAGRRGRSVRAPPTTPTMPVAPIRADPSAPPSQAGPAGAEQYCRPRQDRH